MESDIDADSALQYASIQILSGQQRYDAYVCVANKVEKLSSGNLDHLLPLVPALKELYSKGSNCNFTLQLPENIRGSDWFTRSTFERFLHIINSPDLVSKTKPINQEINQLEEARKFQLAMFSSANQDQSGSGKTDGQGSNLNISTSENGADVQASDASRNVLLRAMDSRLMALTGELAAAFAQTASATCSAEELIAVADFTQLFGATDLENALHRILETNQRSRAAHSVSGIKTSGKLDAKNENTTRTEIAVAHSRPAQAEANVKYSVSPAKVAEIERRSSSGSEEEPSDTDSQEQQAATGRSRTLMRSSARRRSASPMRRVQLGRSGSHRAAAITIKSLNYFPVRSATQVGTHAIDDEDQGSDQTDKKAENEVRKMSVQDRIKIFESKQRDEAADIEKRRSSANSSVGASKSVLRRWSSGVGETSSCYEAEAVCEVSASVNSDEVAIASEVLKVSTPERNSHSGEADEDVKLVENEDIESKSIDDSVDKELNEELTVSDRLASPAEWNRQKEIELNEMMTKMMEAKNVRDKTGLSRSQDVPVKHRGGFYDKYKQKRDERLRGENAGRKAEKRAQLTAMEEAFTERKAEMGTLNGSDGKKGAVKKPQKPLKSPSQTVKPKKESHVHSAAKKAPSRTGPLPAVRKSWPSTPAPRTTGLSPSKASRAPSPAGTTPSSRKPRLPSSVPASTHPKSRPERSPVKRVVKEETRANNPRKLKGGEDKKPQPVPKARRIGKANVTKGSALNNDSTVVPAKPSFYNKVTKKSTVFPLESKSTRKSSGTGDLIKKETKESEASLNDSQNSKEEQCNEQNVADSDFVILPEVADSPSTEPPLTNLEPEVQELNDQKCDETENVGQVFDYSISDLNNVVDTVNELAEEETDISPRAWVEIEEHQDIPPLHDECTFEFVSRANIVPAGSSIPRVRHSLSKMLQEESSEDISEWGNAENPPSLIYQRDAPKGLKKLLKFARKSKGDASFSGWSSPSVFSEGEDDVDDAKASSKRSSENLLKAALHAKNFGPNEPLSGFAKFQDGVSSSAAPTAKATRSFFSLSAFRGSNKPGDAKYR